MTDAAGNRYGPYDIEVAGSQSEALTEDAWFDLFEHISGVKTGGALTFTGLTAHLAPIDMRVHGSFLSRDTEWTDASPATTTSAPRRDLLVARRQRTSGTTAGKTFPILLSGTPASSPVDPPYDAVNDEPLWSWQVPGSGGTVITGQRDLRQFIDRRSGARTPPVLTAYRSTNQGIGGGAAAGVVQLDAVVPGASPGMSLNAASGGITISERDAGPIEVSGVLTLIQAGTPGAAAPPLRLYVAVLLNGAEIRGEDKHARGYLVGDLHGRVLPPIRLNTVANDEIQFGYYHDSSAGATIVPGSFATHFTVRRAA